MVFNPNAQNRRFGEIAQAANPQASDPNQNRNLGGFPGGKRFSYMNNRLQKPGPGATAAPGAAPSTQPVFNTPGAAPGGGLVTLPGGGSLVPPPGQMRGARTLEEVKAEAAAAGTGGLRGKGRYGDGGYNPIPENVTWGGSGYSGADPREAKVADAAPATPEAPPPGAAGGKGGQMANANDAMTDSGFAPPPGVAGGKGGGEAPVPADTIPTASPAAPPTGPESPIVPAGDVGQTGGTNPDGSPIVYNDTGEYDDTTGFAPPFESEYELLPGSEGGKVIGHDKNPDAKARLQKEADDMKAQFIKLGGDPAKFLAFNPSPGQFKGAGSPEAKWKARQAARAAFYQGQLDAAKRANKPGVK